MASINGLARKTITLTRDPSFTGAFTCPIAYRPSFHVPVFNGAGISQASLAPSGTPTSADDIEVEVCAWAIQSIKPGNNGVIDLIGFNQLEVITDVSNMFLNSPFAKPSTRDWIMSNVEIATNMFLNSDTATPDTSIWDVSKIRLMDNMFSSSLLADPDVSSWDTGSVETTFRMFFFTGAANPDVSQWDVKNLEKMTSMFGAASSANPDMSQWQTLSLVSADAVFVSAPSYSRYIDFAGFDISKVTTFSTVFSTKVIPTPDYDAILIAWAAQSVQPNVPVHFGNSKYTAGGAAEAARNTLLAAGWVITDSGSV